MSQREVTSQLHRVLGTWDLVLLNIAAIVGLRWLSTAAQIGPSSLALWTMGLLFFFVPLAFAVLELSARVPGEGGLYLWAKAGFGNVHGFVAGWSYWVVNVVFFPSVLLFSAGVFLHIGGASWLAHSSSVTYNSAYCLTVLWAATALNILGLERAKWLQNLGGIATWTVATLVIGAGAVAWYRFGAATPFTAASLMPDFGARSTYAAFAITAGAFSGLELGPIMGGEIRDPARQLRRAALITGGVVTIIYMAGTASLLVALPTATIDVIGGIPQALAAIGERIGLPHFGALTAGLMALASVGGFGAYLAGTARLPFVVGLDRYLPRALARLHPRHGSPYVALLTQSSFTTLVFAAAMSGTTVHEAFVVLLDMTVILTLLPLLYIFAAFPVLRQRAARLNPGASSPLRNLGCWLVGAAGFSTTSLGIVFSMVPPADDPDPRMFLLKVVGGSVLLLGIGLSFYWRGSRDLKADPEPR
jgi:glutamate:GABA antiporter